MAKLYAKILDNEMLTGFFDMNLIPSNSSFLITCECSKTLSRFINNIVFHISDIPLKVIVTKNPSLYSLDTHIYNEYTPELVKRICKTQQLAFDNRYSAPNADRRIIAVFDNCFQDGTWLQNKNMNTFFTMNRILSITSIFGLPHIYGMTPTLRSNIDYVCIGKHSKNIEIRRIHDLFFHDILSLDAFLELLAKHSWLILHLGLQPKLFHYTVQNSI